MSDILFPICGTTIPKMYGRDNIIRRLWNELTKKIPSHLSIVGPRYCGKTVIIHELANRMKTEESPYNMVIIWDLGHQTPDSDKAFRRSLSHKLGAELKKIGNEYGNLLLNTEEYGDLKEIIEVLNDEQFKILMIWDGFDKPLSNGKLTRNLWDNLRELLSNNTLRLVTATRKPLSELIRSEESQTSDFWNIFNPNPIQVGIFDDNDRDAIIKLVPKISFNNGAKSELDNWTSGYPIFYLSMLNDIIKSGVTGEIDNNIINRTADRVSDVISSYLKYIWNDCSKESKDIYLKLIEEGEIPITSVLKSERTPLLEKGFLKESGNKIFKGCRFLEEYIKDNEKYNSNSMKRLFDKKESYDKNIREFLELRLNQFHSIDPTLRRYLQRSIEDIPHEPMVCLSNMRGIMERTLSIIWDAEFGQNRNIPTDWFSDWQYNGERGAESHWNNQFPTKLGHQIRLLQLITGTQNSSPKAKYISKQIYTLANAMQGFGDFGQHPQGEKIDVGFAVAAVNICLELAACLERELKAS